MCTLLRNGLFHAPLQNIHFSDSHCTLTKWSFLGVGKKGSLLGVGAKTLDIGWPSSNDCQCPILLTHFRVGLLIGTLLDLSQEMQLGL